MLLAELHAAPAYVRAEEYDEQQASTPASFKDMAPKLVTEVADVLVKLDPVPAWLATDSDGTGCLRGHLWLTEESASFLAEGEVPAGFQLPYSSIALHAVSRAVPEDMLAMEKDTTYAKDVCIYCQLDDHPERDDGQDEDEEPSILELWIVVPDSGTLDQLFDALSQCAAMHPSATDSDDAGGHPFAGIAPFGSGALADADTDPSERVRSLLQAFEARQEPK